MLVDASFDAMGPDRHLAIGDLLLRSLTPQRDTSASVGALRTIRAALRLVELCAAHVKGTDLAALCNGLIGIADLALEIDHRRDGALRRQQRR